MTQTAGCARTLLITGASRGIGAACALRAADAGWDVGVHFHRDAAAAERVARQVRERGRRACTLQADVASEPAIEAMFRQLDAELGPLGGLVNNAGIVGPKARLDELDLARWRRMMDVNVLGTLLCSQLAVRRMSTRHGGAGGAIVNLSSVAAVLGAPGQYVDYATSKGAIDTFTVGLGRELANEGIRVNAVRPGIIDTEIHASGGEPDRAHRLAHNVPMKRVGTADEIANAIVWLLSDEASYVTATIIDVSGGR